MSLYALHLANGRTSNTGVFRLLGRLLSVSGVIESTAFTVSAQGTPDMTVKVSGSTVSDHLVIITATGDTYHGWNTANANVAITANSSGVIKKDHIVAYVDTALTTTTPDNPGGLVLLAVRGTGTAAPTDTEINTATSGKPWLRLAEITVANGAGSINSGNIVDLRTFAGIDGAKLSTGSVTQAKAPFALAGPLNNMKVQIASYTPSWNGLAPGAYGTDNITFSQLTDVYAAFALPINGGGGQTAGRLTIYYSGTGSNMGAGFGNVVSFTVFNGNFVPAYASSMTYMAIGT